MRIILLFLIVFLSPPCFAEIDADAMKEFKSYLGSLKSVAIDFRQEDTRGSTAEGTLIIVKPNKFACNYYAPYPLFISGNKSYVSVYDFDLGQLSRIDAGDNMFNFLLTSKVDIENNFHINEATKTPDEIIVELFSTEMDRTTRVTISLKPHRQLKSIVTEESDDNVIKLDVQKVSQITDVDDSLFIIRNPEIYGKPARLDRQKLQEQYRVSKQ